MCVCVASTFFLTLNDGQEDDDDEEEEGDIKDDPDHLKLVPGRVLNLITDSTPRSHTHIHVEHIALENKEE